jgi:hypothetical protein
MLGGLIDLFAPGGAADMPCEVTDGPEDCLHPPDPEPDELAAEAEGP